MALQGHPRSLILAPIKSAYATTYRSLIVTLVLSCPTLKILQVFCSEQRPHPYSTRILGCSLGLDCRCCAVVIIRVISFVLVHSICLRYAWTDGQTDGQLTIAIPHSALCASCGKSSAGTHRQTAEKFRGLFPSIGLAIVNNLIKKFCIRIAIQVATKI